MELEREGYEVVFGYEEALGYSVGDLVRDKDGISAAAVFAELAAVVRSRGRTLQNELEAIARKYGAYASSQVNVTRKGEAGLAAIRAMMDALRAAPPARIGDDEVIAFSDFEARLRRDLRAKTTLPVSFPKSNVLTFALASGSRDIARPSGSEPKAKFYFDVREEVQTGEPVAEGVARAAAKLRRLADAFVAIAGA
jgi:phosphomannomutase